MILASMMSLSATTGTQELQTELGPWPSCPRADTRRMYNTRKTVVPQAQRSRTTIQSRLSLTFLARFPFPFFPPLTWTALVGIIRCSIRFFCSAAPTSSPRTYRVWLASD